MPINRGRQNQPALLAHWARLSRSAYRSARLDAGGASGWIASEAAALFRRNTRSSVAANFSLIAFGDRWLYAFSMRPVAGMSTVNTAVISLMM